MAPAACEGRGSVLALPHGTPAHIPGQHCACYMLRSVKHAAAGCASPLTAEARAPSGGALDRDARLTAAQEHEGTGEFQGLGLFCSPPAWSTPPTFVLPLFGELVMTQCPIQTEQEDGLVRPRPSITEPFPSAKCLYVTEVPPRGTNAALNEAEKTPKQTGHNRL